MISLVATWTIATQMAEVRRKRLGHLGSKDRDAEGEQWTTSHEGKNEREDKQ